MKKFMSNRKTKIESVPELYSGETGDLRLLVEILWRTKALVIKEIERLESLRSNPTFPTEHYAEQIKEVWVVAVHLKNTLAEVKL